MTNRNRKIVVILLLNFLLLSILQATDWSQEYEKYPQCDGIDREGVVHPEKKNSKIDGFAEKICIKKERIAQSEERIAQSEEHIAQSEERIAQSEERIAQSEERIAQGKEEYKKLVEILALLSPKALEKEIKKLEIKIKNEDDSEEKKRLESKLTILKENRMK